jgi:uncharacterized membrane protein YphA (DoxX/SURF4 family)
MTTKTIKILYWVLLGLFCLFHIFDAIGGLSMAQAGIDAMHAMGYPAYLMPFLAVLKLLGAAALLQNKFTRIKEWAFAGFTFTLIGASVSHMCTDRNPLFIVLPIVFLAIPFVVYSCWRKLNQVQVRAV